jgi:uncharacterized membrane protein (UPF0127 family)
MRSWPLLVALVALSALLGGCAGAAPDLEQRDVQFDGRTWTVLVATPDGMRGRDGFGDADGMLFDLGQTTDPTAVVFVMDGVAFPIDIGWFAEDGTFLGWAEMEPCQATPCPRYQAHAPFRWALEAPRDAFDDVGPYARLEVGPEVGP